MSQTEVSLDHDSADAHRHLIFLISLPRSGSTLLQRILGGSSDVHTTAEPWLMLHPLHALKTSGIKAIYDQNLAVSATSDFLSQIPENMELFYQAVRRYGLTLYNRALENSGKKRFLDKTPRYYSIIPELWRTFPDARYIILLRNPLAVMSSVLQTWCRNDPEILSRTPNRHDLSEGPGCLLNGLKLLGNKARVIHYEHLVTNPEHEIRALCDDLGIAFSDQMLVYGQRKAPRGKFGDTVGIHRHSMPVSDKVDKWVLNLTSAPLRQSAVDYLYQLGQETFSQMGYDFGKMASVLNTGRATLESARGEERPKAPLRVSSEACIRVSAVISAYNSERYMEGRLQNLVDQSLFTKRQLEIVVVDSCSPENEKSIVDRFSARYPNIRYLRTNERESVYTAWNRGIDMAAGRYFVNANTDDRFSPEALELMAEALDSNPGYDAAYGNWLVTRTPNDTFDSDTLKHLFIYPEFHPGLFFYLQITSHANFVRRSVFEKIGAFDGGYTVFGDREFMFRFAAAGYRALKLDRTTGLYFENPTSVERANKDIGRKECTALYDRYLAPERFAALMGCGANTTTDELSRRYTQVSCFGMGLYDIDGKPAHALGTPARLLPKAIELDPKNVEALNNMGVVAQHLESFQLACQFLTGARSLADPKQTAVIDHNLDMAQRNVSDPDQLRFLYPPGFRSIRVVQASCRHSVPEAVFGKTGASNSNRRRSRRKDCRKTRKKSSPAYSKMPPPTKSCGRAAYSESEHLIPKSILTAYLSEDYQATACALQELLFSHPDHWPAYALLTDVMLQSGRAAAIPEGLRPLECRSDLPPRMLALIGSGYEAAGDLKSAARFAKQALSADPGCAHALNLEGVLAFRNGDMDQAIGRFLSAIENNAVWGEPWTNLGSVYWAQDLHDNALDCFEKGFRLSPTAPNVATNFHAAISETGRYECAKPLFEDVVKRHPDFRRARFLLIDVLVRMEDYVDALAQIEAVMVRFGTEDHMLAAARAVRAKVGPTTVPQGKHPSLSLCMIVKNEARHLPRCLERLKQLVDEMIVVDTGSTDATRDIAEIFGARVFDFEWQDDFAAARNHSIEKASGDWILIMDADETIAACDHKSLIRLIKKTPRSDAFLMTTRNYTHRTDSADYRPNNGDYPEEKGTGWVPSKKVRLFRNHQGVHFVFPVHEQVDPVLLEKGVALRECAIPVHHEGKLDMHRAAERWKLYYRIGKKKLHQLGDDKAALKEMAIQAALLSHWEEAAAYWKRYLELVPRSLAAHMHLTRAMAECGDFEQARRFALAASRLAPDRLDALYNLALVRLQTGQADESVQTAERLLEKFPGNTDARLLQAIAEMCAGRTKQGLAHIRQLSEDTSGDVLLPRARSLVASIRAAGQEDWVRMLVGQLSRIDALQPIEAQVSRTPNRKPVAMPPMPVASQETDRLFNAARRAFEREDCNTAFNLLNRTVSLQPDHWEAYALLTDVLLQSGQTAAIPEQLQPLENRDDLPAKTVTLIGSGYEAAGDLARATEFARRALALDPGCARALNLQGVLAFRRGDLATAKGHFQKAADNDANWGEPWTNLGTVCWEQGDRETALESFAKGFHLSPTAPNVATTYHAAVSETGRYEAARALFQEVVERHPDFRRARFLLIDLLIRLEARLQALEQIETVLVRFGVDAQLLEAAKAVRAGVGPSTISPKHKCPSLSLCMIVKDEERCLPRCLANLKPLVDEMIVVDTGSSDTTRDIAEVFGARVFDFEWRDDFAAARNHSLEQAQGDWILVMDADETIAESDHATLRRLLHKTQDAKLAFLITTRNYTHKYNGIGWEANKGVYPDLEAGCGWIPSTKTRLFRNHPSIRFEYPVHELVDPALERKGYRLKACAIPVHHYGFLDLAKVNLKGKHYHAIGKKKLNAMQNDPKAIHELAVQANLLGDHKEAIKLWNRLAAVQPKEVKVHINLSAAYGKLGAYKEAKSAALKAMAVDPESKEARLNLGRSEFFMGNFFGAQGIFEKLVRSDGRYYAALFMLGAAQICSGSREQGMATIQQLKPLGIWGSISCAMRELADVLIGAGLGVKAQELLRCAAKLDFSPPIDGAATPPVAASAAVNGCRALSMTP